MITGRSVHNQRIEYFWRELSNGCIHHYYAIFQEMEEENILNIDSISDMCALHNVFIPELSGAIAKFVDSYRHHPLRTAGNQSPYQLWISSLFFTEDVTLIDCNSDNCEIDCEDYGIDWDGPVSTLSNYKDSFIDSSYTGANHISDIIGHESQLQDIPHIHEDFSISLSKCLSIVFTENYIFHIMISVYKIKLNCICDYPLRHTHLYN